METKKEILKKYTGKGGIGSFKPSVPDNYSDNTAARSAFGLKTSQVMRPVPKPVSPKDVGIPKVPPPPGWTPPRRRDPENPKWNSPGGSKQQTPPTKIGIPKPNYDGFLSDGSPNYRRYPAKPSISDGNIKYYTGQGGSKKSILKKYTGKGGIVGDTIKEIPGTLLGMAKNFSKAVDPAQTFTTWGPKAIDSIKSKIRKGNTQSYIKPTAVPIPGRTPGEQGFEIKRGGETTKKEVLQKAIRKTGVGTRYPDMAPLKNSMPLKRIPSMPKMVPSMVPKKMPNNIREKPLKRMEYGISKKLNK